MLCFPALVNRGPGMPTLPSTCPILTHTLDFGLDATSSGKSALIDLSEALSCRNGHTEAARLRLAVIISLSGISALFSPMPRGTGLFAQDVTRSMI